MKSNNKKGSLPNQAQQSAPSPQQSHNQAAPQYYQPQPFHGNQAVQARPASPFMAQQQFQMPLQQYPSQQFQAQQQFNPQQYLPQQTSQFVTPMGSNRQSIAGDNSQMRPGSSGVASPQFQTAPRQSAGPQCIKCGLLCDFDGFIALKDGTSYHKACFTCEYCQQALQLRFVSKNGQHFHQECYTFVKSQCQKCENCQNYVLPSEQAVQLENGSCYHVQCYLCDQCGLQLGELVLPFGNLLFHQECMSCVNCNKSLRDQVYDQLPEGFYACLNCLATQWPDIYGPQLMQYQQQQVQYYQQQSSQHSNLPYVPQQQQPLNQPFVLTGMAQNKQKQIIAANNQSMPQSRSETPPRSLSNTNPLPTYNAADYAPKMGLSVAPSNSTPAAVNNNPSTMPHIRPKPSAPAKPESLVSKSTGDLSQLPKKGVPATSNTTSGPPPPPPLSSTGMPPPQAISTSPVLLSKTTPSVNDLMSQIRTTGKGTLKSADSTTSSKAMPKGTNASFGKQGQGDLQSALAAALKKKRSAHKPEEDEAHVEEGWQTTSSIEQY